VDDFRSKVKYPEEDQSAGSSGFNSLRAHFFSVKVPSNITPKGPCFPEQADNRKNRMNRRYRCIVL
jgi:hypothetical protein